jgi:hypothetical protein
MFDFEAVKARVTAGIRKLNARLLEVAKQLEKEMAANSAARERTLRPPDPHKRILMRLPDETSETRATWQALSGCGARRILNCLNLSTEHWNAGEAPEILIFRRTIAASLAGLLEYLSVGEC